MTIYDKQIGTIVFVLKMVKIKGKGVLLGHLLKLPISVKEKNKMLFKNVYATKSE